MKTALRSALEGAVISAADRAAEDADSRWRTDAAGSAMLLAAEQARASGRKADWLYASAFGMARAMSRS